MRLKDCGEDIMNRNLLIIVKAFTLFLMITACSSNESFQIEFRTCLKHKELNRMKNTYEINGYAALSGHKD